MTALCHCDRVASLRCRPGARWVWLLSLLLLFSAGSSIARASTALYRRTVRVGNTIYLSAQGDRDPLTGNRPTDMRAATRLAMNNLKRGLAAEGLTFNHVVSAQVWLTDLAQYDAMNAIYKTFFETIVPTRTTLGVSALPGGGVVQIAMVAYTGTKTTIGGPAAALNSLPFSPAILAGDTLYLSGQIGLDPATGQLVEGDLATHVDQALENIERLLKAADMDFSHVVSSYLYLQDVDQFAAASAAYLTRITQEPRPARMPMGVAALPRDSPVEITMIASRKTRQERRGADQPASGAYSRGLLSDGVMHLAGVFRRAGSLAEQVNSCIAWIKPILAAGSMSLRDVVEVRVYLADMQDYPQVAAAYRRHFPEDPPTLAVVAVPKLPAKSRLMMGLVAATASPVKTKSQ